MKVEIIPAIMPKNWEDLEGEVAKVAPFVKAVQIDVMDGKFVKSKSWPYMKRRGNDDIFKQLQVEDLGLPFWQEVDYEADLMIDKPEEEIENWIAAGMSRIIVHIESTQKMPEIVKMFEAYKAYPENPGDEMSVDLGLALNIDTPTEEILPYLEDIEFVQFMGIDTIGLQGQSFDERVADKIREFHNAHPEVAISVDGGVSLENARSLVEAGASRLVSGSAIFESEDAGSAIENLKHIVQ